MAAKRSADDFALPFRKKVHVESTHVGLAHDHNAPFEPADVDDAKLITRGVRLMFSTFQILDIAPLTKKSTSPGRHASSSHSIAPIDITRSRR